MTTPTLYETLLRVDNETLLELSRRWAVGSRRSHEELAESLADRMRDRQHLSDRIATLRESDRGVLHKLLDTDAISLDEDCALYLGTGAAEALGLVVNAKTADGDEVSFVPTDIAALISERLVAVPAAPEEVTRRRRRSPSGSRPAVKKQTEKRPTSSTSADGFDIDIDLLSQRQIARDIARSVTIAPASAMVELRSAREARIAQNDRELGAAVLDVLEETLVILRASVDPADWVQRLAVRLEES